MIYTKEYTKRFSEKQNISSSFEALDYVQRHIEEVHHLLFVIIGHFELLEYAYNAKDPYTSIVNQINNDFPGIIKAARQAGYNLPDLKGKFPSREDLAGEWSDKK